MPLTVVLVLVDSILHNERRGNDHDNAVVVLVNVVSADLGLARIQDEDALDSATVDAVLHDCGVHT